MIDRPTPRPDLPELRPDGRTLAVGYDDTTILIWNLPQPEKRAPVAAIDRDAVWVDLASPDPTKGHAVMWRLIDDPKTAMPLLRERLFPAPVAVETIHPHVADLGNASFAKRETAETKLRDLGRSAISQLRSALMAEQRPEAKRRLESLIAGFESEEERRRGARAMAVLERIGTTELRGLLEKLGLP